jgi:hypothetical protein
MNQTTVLVIAIASIVLGVLNQGVASGKILGAYAWPTALTPWATPVAAFIIGFEGSLQSGTVSYEAAAIAGVVAIAGTFGVQVGLHAHVRAVVAPPTAAEKRAAEVASAQAKLDAAKKDGAS